MGTEIRVEVIHKETITPSSPTPPHLRRKFKYNDSICCNDHGAAFVQAQVNCTLSKILKKPDYGVLNQLLPTEFVSTQEVTGHLLLVQANFFECGAMAIGVNVSHKVADAFTFSTFINSWAEVALGSSTTDHIVLPAAEFGVAASLCPPLDFFNSPQPVVEYDIKEKLVTKRFVFEASKIDALKSKAAISTMPNPTRVEVVSALIFKCAIEALSRSNLGSVRSSAWYQRVNMRKLLGQPSLMGNLVGLFAAKTEETEESEANHQSLVAMLREGIEKFRVKFCNGVSGNSVCEMFNEYGKLMQRDDIDKYNCTSWCRFPFYEANFGWGKPSWVTIPSIGIKNLIVLIDTRDGDGIEVSMSLKEEDMALIETNEELLSYASLNPAVI